MTYDTDRINQTLMPLTGIYPETSVIFDRTDFRTTGCLKQLESRIDGLLYLSTIQLLEAARETYRWAPVSEYDTVA
jgi:hypothetical protein